MVVSMLRNSSIPSQNTSLKIGTYCECGSVALGIHHAMRMRHIVIYGLPPLQNLSKSSHKRKDFRKKDIEHKMCFDFLCDFCVKHSKKN